MGVTTLLACKVPSWALVCISQMLIACWSGSSWDMLLCFVLGRPLMCCAHVAGISWHHCSMCLPPIQWSGAGE